MHFQRDFQSPRAQWLDAGFQKGDSRVRTVTSQLSELYQDFRPSNSAWWGFIWRGAWVARDCWATTVEQTFRRKLAFNWSPRPLRWRAFVMTYFICFCKQVLCIWIFVNESMGPKELSDGSKQRRLFVLFTLLILVLPLQETSRNKLLHTGSLRESEDVTPGNDLSLFVLCTPE